MSDFDWIAGIPPQPYTGMKFKIPSNSSLKNYILKIIQVTEKSYEIVWRDEESTSHNIYIEKEFANKQVQCGVWELV